MSEFRSEIPKPNAPVEEWQQLWDELVAIDKFDTMLLVEVLEAIDAMDSKPPRATWSWGQCPYLEDSERYKLWCAIGYAVEIGEYVKARSLARKLEHARRHH